MRFSLRTEWLQIVLLAAMLLLAAVSWGNAPERIPVHWNAAGHVDRWGGRFEGLLGIPLLALCLYVVMLLLPRIDPGRANYPAFASSFVTLRLAVTAMLAAVYGLVHLWMRGIEVDMMAWVPLLLGALFLVIGNLMGKLRPNWFVGIRTPWTLSSKLAWQKTHRAGGWLFIAMGMAFFALGVGHSRRAGAVILVVSLAGAFALGVYSYFVWRKDPDRVPPAGTLPWKDGKQG